MALLQVQLHERIIDLHHLVDQLGVGLCDGGEIRGASVGREEAIHHRPSAIGRQVERQAFGPELRPDLLEAGLEVNIVRVDVIDDDEAIEIARLGPLHHAAGDHLHPGLCIHDHCHGFDRGEHGQRPAEEIGITGGVEEVDARAPVIEADYLAVQRMAMGLLEGVEVRHGGPSLHAAG